MLPTNSKMVSLACWLLRCSGTIEAFSVLLKLALQPGALDTLAIGDQPECPML